MKKECSECTVSYCTHSKSNDKVNCNCFNPYTPEQSEILNALYTLGYRWIGHDNGTQMYAFTEKPIRGQYYWYTPVDSTCCSIFGEAYNKMSQIIKQTDAEPFDIAKAVGR